MLSALAVCNPALAALASQDDGKPLTPETPADALAAAVAIRPQETLPTEWGIWPNAKEAYAKLTEAFLSHQTPPSQYPDTRGIVTAGGGVKYFPSLYVLIRRLRALGCKLPISVWYLGRAEMDPHMVDILEKLGNVTCINAHALFSRYPVRILNGWELKPYSIICSPYREVLFLDADNLPAYDPTPLFDCQQYKRRGAVLWPDFPHWSFTAEQWKTFGLPFGDPPPGSDDDPKNFGKPIPADRDPPIESGQMLFNKAAHEQSLRLALWHCEHSDFTFQHVRGDHHALHIALKQLKASYAYPPIWPNWDTHTIVQYDFAGKPLFYHRTQDKFTMGRTNRSAAWLPDEHICHEYIEELTGKWCGVPWHNPDVLMAGKEFIYCRMGFDRRRIKLMPGGLIGAGADWRECRWGVFRENNKPLLAICGWDGLTCLLRETDAHTWEGRWLVGEKPDVRMTEVSKPQEGDRVHP